MNEIHGVGVELSGLPSNDSGIVPRGNIVVDRRHRRRVNTEVCTAVDPEQISRSCSSGRGKRHGSGGGELIMHRMGCGGGGWCDETKGNPSVGGDGIRPSTPFPNAILSMWAVLGTISEMEVD